MVVQLSFCLFLSSIVDHHGAMWWCGVKEKWQLAQRDEEIIINFFTTIYIYFFWITLPTAFLTWYYLEGLSLPISGF